MPNDNYKSMTVAELIAFLSSFPSDMEVIIPVQYREYYEIDGGKVVKGRLELDAFEKSCT